MHHATGPDCTPWTLDGLHLWRLVAALAPMGSTVLYCWRAFQRPRTGLIPPPPQTYACFTPPGTHVGGYFMQDERTLDITHRVCGPGWLVYRWITHFKGAPNSCDHSVWTWVLLRSYFYHDYVLVCYLHRGQVRLQACHHTHAPAGWL